jgi:alkanesulfonate monooxygenase SsuD/methylene tetrahydromethanopterin reductase-like flavin-dependent oxidoreductase (luciferase family)
VRAQKLDEGLDILTGLWSGEPFRHDGGHYRIADTTFHPKPVQSPRIPVWVAAMWPNRAPVRRSARWDGVVPIHPEPVPLSPREVADIVAYARRHGAEGRPFEVVLSGESSGQSPYALKEPLRSYEDAGATWWNEVLTDWRGSLESMRPYVRGGPPG